MPIDTTRETQMKIRNPDLIRRDWGLCCSYVKEMQQKGLPAYELWELELEAWATNPDRQPRKSTVTKLRLRFPPPSFHSRRPYEEGGRPL